MPSLLERLNAAEKLLAGPGRYMDMGLALTREAAPSEPPILQAGGRWDTISRRILDPVREADCDEYTIITLMESQLPFFRWYAEWLGMFRDGLPRDTSVAMMIGDRRGGKSVALVTAILAGCIDVPLSPSNTPTIAALVAKSYRERFELEDWILTRIPSGPRGFYRHRGAPEHQFIFHSGAVLRMLSADDPDAIKQGRFDLIGFNEPQKIHQRAVANGVMATADLGGLAILAANPPDGSGRGDWLFDLKDALDDEAHKRNIGTLREVDKLGIQYFSFDSKNNAAIDQQARRRAGRIGAIIDPSIQAGDVEGEWRRKEDKALWEFDKRKHLLPVPAVGLADITRSVASERGEYGEWEYVAGVDFQTKPHIITVIYRIFGDLDDPMFVAVDEFAGERKWTEELYLEAFREKFPRYRPDNLLWIGDASSDWQGIEHDFEGGERDSFAVWRGDGWTIIQPQPSKNTGRKSGRGRNPEVSDRLQLANELLRRGKWRADPIACPWVAECARKATTKTATGRRVLTRNHFAHAIDAVTYPLWRLAPKPSEGGTEGPPMVTIPVTRGENPYG